MKDKSNTCQSSSESASFMWNKTDNTVKLYALSTAHKQHRARYRNRTHVKVTHGCFKQGAAANDYEARNISKHTKLTGNHTPERLREEKQFKQENLISPCSQQCTDVCTCVDIPLLRTSMQEERHKQSHSLLHVITYQLHLASKRHIWHKPSCL